MEDYFRTGLQNFLYNAGIIGFIEILDKSKCRGYYKIEGSELIISNELFLNEEIDLAYMYYSAFRDKFQKDTVYQEILNMNDRLKNSKMEEKPLEDLLKKLKGYIERNSYKSGYEILKQKGQSYNPVTELKALKNIEDSGEKINKAIEITEYIIKYPEVFCFKDIIYTKISKIWTNMSFLNSQNSKKNMIEIHREVFINPIKKWIQKPPKAKDFCIECGIPVSAAISTGFSWLNNMGVDYKRKSSYFWDFKPDSYLCPLCAFIYSCAPLGFSYSKIGSDCIFINNNESIEALKKINTVEKNDIDKISNDETIRRMTYKIISKIINEQIQQKQKNELRNIQVILKQNDSRYNINMLNKAHLSVINECKNEFEKLTDIYLQLSNKERIYLFEESLNNLINGNSQYALVNLALRKGFSEGDYVGYVQYLLKIQLVTKGGNTMVTKSMIRSVTQSGVKLRKKFSDGSEKGDDKKSNIDNKLRGFAYQLLNAIQVGDYGNFINIVSRMYIGIGEPIPGIFAEMINDDEAFKDLGYAYILGLKGTAEEYKNEKQKDNTNVENTKEGEE